MTLKTRLTAMMIVILVAVVGLQFLLMEQERRELTSRLSRLSDAVNRSTAQFVERSHTLSSRIAGGPPGAIQEFLREIEVDSLGKRENGSVSVQMLIWSDSSAVGETKWRQATSDEVVIRRVEATAVGGPVEFRARAESLIHRVRGGALSPPPPGAEKDIVIHLPLPAGGPDSLYSVEVRYGFGHVAEELAASRRRGVLWMTAILGVGVLGAVLVARQFTKPIQILQASFGEVTRGNLELQVQPQRNDEIGALTDSFNQMVARLRESRAMEQRLAQTEHLASLGQLAAGVAHEVRNPLNAILLTLQHMRDRARTAQATGVRDPELEVLYELAANEIARLDRMVGAFLDLSKSGELRRERLDLAESLRGSVALFQPVADARGVSLRGEIESPLEVDADATRLPMVWNNLIANAIEATPRGETVVVSARREGERIVVAVADTGSGIEPGLLPRIWDPFVSGKDSGAGLGLSIVRSVVERHGGEIEVESRVGEGTVMTVGFGAVST